MVFVALVASNLQKCIGYITMATDDLCGYQSTLFEGAGVHPNGGPPVREDPPLEKIMSGECDIEFPDHDRGYTLVL